MTIFENISLINYLNKFVKFNFLHFSNERAAKEEKKDHYKKWKLIEKRIYEGRCKKKKKKKKKKEKYKQTWETIIWCACPIWEDGVSMSVSVPGYLYTV